MKPLDAEAEAKSSFDGSDHAPAAHTEQSTSNTTKKIKKKRERCEVIVPNTSDSTKIPVNPLISFELVSNSQRKRKLYNCPHCSKKFLRRSNVHDHMMIHYDIRPFECKQCGKRFR